MSDLRLPPRPARRRLAAALLLASMALAACDEALVERGLTGPPAGGAGPQLQPVTSQQLVAQFGVQLDTPLRVRVLDADGQPVRSAVVKYNVLAGSGTFSSDSTLTNDQGFTEVTFRPTSAGTVLVEARTGEGASADQVQFSIVVLNDPTEPATLERASGNAQTGPVGSVLAEPLVVRVRNLDGFPVTGATVTFTVERSTGDSAGVAATRGGTPAGQITVQTDASGEARAFLKVGTLPGSHTVQATVAIGPQGSQATQSVAFTATATAIGVDALRIVSGDNQTVVIDTLHLEDDPEFKGRDPNPLVVQALDRFGTPVPGVTVQWFVSDGGGVLISSTTVTDANGLTSNMLEGVTEGRNAVVAFASGADPVEFEITGVVFVPQEGDGGSGGGG